MDIQKAFNYLSLNYDFSKIFSHNSNYNFPNNERIYLDETGLKGQRLYKFLLEKTEVIASKYIQDRYFVALVNFSPEKSKKEDYILSDMEQFNLALPDEYFYHEEYIEEDEWFIKCLFFYEYKNPIKSYFDGILSCHIPTRNKKKFLKCEPFIFDLELKYRVDLYDDRGMDILFLRN